MRLLNLMMISGESSNGQIVTGDSQGNVKVFNGKNDTQISSFKSHKSDVLCLAAAGVGYCVTLYFIADYETIRAHTFTQPVAISAPASTPTCPNRAGS